MTYRERVAANVRAELARRNMKPQALEESLSLGRTAVRERLNGNIGFSLDELPVIAHMIGIPIAVLTHAEAEGRTMVEGPQ